MRPVSTVSSRSSCFHRIVSKQLPLQLLRRSQPHSLIVSSQNSPHQSRFSRGRPCGRPEPATPGLAWAYWRVTVRRSPIRRLIDVECLFLGSIVLLCHSRCLPHAQFRSRLFQARCFDWEMNRARHRPTSRRGQLEQSVFESLLLCQSAYHPSRDSVSQIIGEFAN